MNELMRRRRALMTAQGEKIWLIRDGVLQNNLSLVRGGLTTNSGNSDSVTTVYAENGLLVFKFVSNAKRTSTYASWTFSPATPQIAGKRIHAICQRIYMNGSVEWAAIIASPANDSGSTLSESYGDDKELIYPKAVMEERVSGTIPADYQYISFIIQKWGNVNSSNAELIIKDMWIE